MFSRKSNRRKTPIKVRLRSSWDGFVAAMRKILPLVFLAAVAVAVPFGIFTAYLHIVSTPYFAVDDVRVEGLKLLTEDEVLRKGGIVPGSNVFDVDLERIEASLEAEPWIRQVHLEKRLPGTLILRVEERSATAILVDGPAYVLLDGDGEPFKNLEPGDAVDELLELPLITGLTRAEASAEPGQTLVVEAMEVVRLARANGLPELSEVHIDPVMGLSVVPADSGIEIRLGRGRYADRIQRLRAVFAAIEKEGREVDYIIIDQEGKLNRVTVGSRAKDGSAPQSPN